MRRLFAATAVAIISAGCVTAGSASISTPDASASPPFSPVVDPNPSPPFSPFVDPNPSPPFSPVIDPYPSPPFGETTVLTITCDGTAATLNASTVRALPGGVQVRSIAIDGAPAVVDVSAGTHGTIASIRGAAALVLAPGSYTVTCFDPWAEERHPVPFDVSDPDALWMTSEVSCTGGSGTAGSADAPPAPPAAAMAFLRTTVQLQPGEIMEPAGYPKAPSGWIRLVRDGQVVASWQVLQGSGDEVFVNATRRCSEAISPTP